MDPYPHFHADADGNIIAYSNGVAVTIVHAHRRADHYTTALAHEQPERDAHQHDHCGAQPDAANSQDWGAGGMGMGTGVALDPSGE